MLAKIYFLICFSSLLFIEKANTLDPQYALRRRIPTVGFPSPVIDEQPLQIQQSPEVIPLVQNTVQPKKASKRGPVKKVIAQIVKKYRLDKSDGSILWGYENDDGSFKEEVIGFDCITRGKYGYTDPEGKRREFAYETGIKCNKNNTNVQKQEFND